MSYFLKSMFFFITLIFKRKVVDVIFYYPHHFNRGPNAKNMLFDHLYKSCENNNLSYLIFEEPDLSSCMPRNKKAVPFDFAYFFIVFLRKIIRSDRIIGKILSGTILRGLRFKNYIVLSQSMLSIFRAVNKRARLFDLQHGLIHKNKLSYIEHLEASRNLKDNDVYLLLYGEGFRSILLKNDLSRYFNDRAIVIGSSKEKDAILHTENNKNILVSLQFTEDHTEEQNNLMAIELERFIKSHQDYDFFLRNHPRYSDEIDLNRFLKFNNVQFANSTLNDCFKTCSVHLTTYSTTTFEASASGVPTLFLTSLPEKINIFKKDFCYPIKNSLRFIEDHYNEVSLKVKDWEQDFFCLFDERKFISSLI